METQKITPTAKQREAYIAANNNRITLYGGAIRGGKSYFLILYAFTLAFKYERSRWVFLRETLPTLKRTLLVTLNEFIQNGFGQYVKDFNQSTLTLTLTNGSQFIFMAEGFDTDKELNRFRGLEINGAFIDEANEIQEVTFDKIIERAGSWFHSEGCPSKIIMTANPTNGWLKDRIYDKWANDTLPNGIAYIPAKIFDNPYIPPEYLESLKMLPRYQYEVFVEGNWDIQLKTGGEFYKCFELDKHVSKETYNPDIPLHISWDDNVNPYLPCGIFQIVGKKVMMIDEIAGKTPLNTIKSVCAEFKRRYPAHKTGLFVYGDATAQKEDTKMEKGYNFYRLIQDELKDYRPNMRISKANPSVAMRGNWINTVLEKELGGIKILIDDKCKNTINDFVLLKESADGTKAKEMETDSKTKVRYQKVGHFTDLFDYLLCMAFADEFVRYQTGDVQKSINFSKNIPKNTFR